MTIDYLTNEILIPKSDTTFVKIDPVSGREIRSLDMDYLWRSLADIQDNAEDICAPTCFENNVPKDLDTFVQGRSVLILSPYFVTFEDGTYAVNLKGGNTNLKGRLTVNSVSVNTDNTAGFIQVTSGSGITEQDKLDIASKVWNEMASQHTQIGSTGEAIQKETDITEQDKLDIAEKVWNKTLP